MTEQNTPLRPLQPTLYALADDGHSLDFFFMQCPSCDGLNFPANVPGCMHCGDALDKGLMLTRPAIGTLLEYATLHVPLTPGMAAPSIAGDVLLAQGIVEEGVIAVADDKLLAPGMTLKAVAKVRDAEGTYGCEFIPADREAAR